MPLGILCEQPACILKHDVIAHAGEHVEHLTLFRSRITNAVGRNQWDAQTPGGFEPGLIASFFFAVEMPLDLCENITPAKDVDRKSTRLNSSHANISYAVFCLKKNINKGK